MEIAALATDYDGTIAHDGTVGERTLAALRHFKSSGRRVLLVTGRELEDLRRVCPFIDLFDCVVGENGAVLYWPDTGVVDELAQAPPGGLPQHLRELGVNQLSVGRVIVATVEPYRATVLKVIAEMGLTLQVALNKGAVMVLPYGVDKASGLRAALGRLDIDIRNVAAVGDAENDYPFLRLCGYSAAVANALPALKQQVNLVLSKERGPGVEEFIRKILALDQRENPNRPVLADTRAEGS